MNYIVPDKYSENLHNKYFLHKNYINTVKNDGFVYSVAGMFSVLHLYICISPASSVLCYILVLLFSVVSIFW